MHPRRQVSAPAPTDHADAPSGLLRRREAVVVGSAQAAEVGYVQAQVGTLGNRLDVIHHVGGDEQPGFPAESTERFGSEMRGANLAPCCAICWGNL
jgi:hypothetical protein